MRGEEGARRPGPKGQPSPAPRPVAQKNITSSATSSAASLRGVLRRVLVVLVLHVSPNGSVRWAWVPPLEDNARHDKHLHAPIKIIKLLFIFAGGVVISLHALLAVAPPSRGWGTCVKITVVEL